MNQTLTPSQSHSATQAALTTARIAIVSANWHSDVAYTNGCNTSASTCNNRAQTPLSAPRWQQRG